ncbi:hypothetical protein EYE40_11120 [Glaciihabitans arcticus]|uniref:Uncharacterized protein n=1 Tax=Glaciihabitans arcticus TaxID=2668039 RepID=A0A4Q9GZQ1_9MICO|nr:hypothetical protein [Glaciihabitans arcticus]TBN57900.1 hypothetical protein EYE40_11120 [Glaciihabitans arcticus]
MVTITEVPPRRRYQRPLWELRDDGGRLVGWVRQHVIRGSSSVFYKAIGVHPQTGEHVTLESSTDREERFACILSFLANPESVRGVHWHPRGPAVAGHE